MTRPPFHARNKRHYLLTSAAAAALALLMLAPTHASGREIGPESDFCHAIRSLPQGDELVLLPGDYQGPCVIDRDGGAGAPLVIRAADPARRPRIVYGGRDSDVIQVRAIHITLRGLEFGPTQQGVDAVRIFNGGDVTVEDCAFTHLGGIAVVANHSSIHGLMVRRNVVRNSTSTAMYFGCHDGEGCMVSGLVVEANFIENVTALDPEIGYGIQFKLNSSGTIRDNIVINTKGPSIMIYGSRYPKPSVVERNVTIGSRTSSGIVVGGGPAIIRNNIAESNELVGIELTDYKNRGLLRTILVANNTVYGNRLSGITVPETGLSNVTVVNNAADANGSPNPFPVPQIGLSMAGNVNCTDVACFLDPEHRDFSPGPHSRLKGAGVWVKTPWMPRDDFFGIRRGSRSTAGAIERPSGPLGLVPPR